MRGIHNYIRLSVEDNMYKAMIWRRTIAAFFVCALMGVLLVQNSEQDMRVNAHNDDANVGATSMGVAFRGAFTPMPHLNGEAASTYLKEQGLYSSISEALETSRYGIRPTEDARLPRGNETFVGDNPRQEFTTYFGNDGIQMVSNVKSENWRLRMNLEGYGYGDNIVPIEQTGMQVQRDKRRIELQKSAKSNSERPSTKPEIVEWYENSTAGLEQGWTIRERLTDRGELSELHLAISLAGNLKAEMASDGQSIRFISRLNEAILSYENLKSWDADGKLLESRMELKGEQLEIVVAEEYAKYPITIDPLFTQIKKLTPSTAAARNNFGNALSIYGNTAVVGASCNGCVSGEVGKAYIFERNLGGTNNWGEVKMLTASDPRSNNKFGHSVAISGDTVLIAAPSAVGANSTSGGAVYVFERNAGGVSNWGEVKRIAYVDPNSTFFGFAKSVSLSGDTAIVGGAPNSIYGAAYIFERNNGGANSWGLVKRLSADPPQPSNVPWSDFFGNSVSIDGDTVIVGAEQFTLTSAIYRGSAYIFERNVGGANNWGRARVLIASDAASDHSFGKSVGISGDNAIVGSYRSTAYIFERGAGGVNNWGEVKKLARGGQSVAISGGSAIAGTIGYGYLLERNAGGTNNWGEIKVLRGYDTVDDDLFGLSVGIAGDTVMVGAAQDDDFGDASGSAYIFNRNTSCTFTLSSYSVQIGASVGTGGFSVNGATNCLWQAVSNDPWITITGQSWGSGNGSLLFSVAANLGAARSGTITAFDQTFTINQAIGCSFSLSSGSSNVGAAGGSGSFDLDTTSACPWNAVTNDSWITVTAGSSGTGNGTISFAVAVNMGPARTGTITAGGRTFTINQANGCAYSLSTYNTTVPGSGGTGGFNVTTVSGCVWMAISNAPWLTITSGSSGTGNRTVNYSVQANNGLGRTGQINVNGQTFTLNQLARPNLRTRFDFNGDGRADYSVFRPLTNKWWILHSSEFSLVEKIFAIPGDVVAPADYNGDGKTDIGIFRPSSGDWWYLSSIDNTSQVNIQFGANGDLPRPSDFDGDGKDDFIVFRPSNSVWYRLGSTGAMSVTAFGANGDKPLIGDFDGDGKSDLCIYRPSTGTWWYFSSVDGSQRAAQFGVSSDTPVPADYDGDGKTDFAVYRPSTGVWYILNSSNGQATIVGFGLAEDKPVPADYDGDGKADIAVFRPSSGLWYLLRSTEGFGALNWGISTDTPIPNAFISP